MSIPHRRVPGGSLHGGSQINSFVMAIGGDGDPGSTVNGVVYGYHQKTGHGSNEKPDNVDDQVVMRTGFRSVSSERGRSSCQSIRVMS